MEVGSIYIEIANTHPILTDGLRRPTGAEILRLGMQAREKAFMIDMQKGVFDDLARRAMRYPGVFIA